MITHLPEKCSIFAADLEMTKTNNPINGTWQMNKW